MALFPNGSTVTFGNGYAAKVQQISGFQRSVVSADVSSIDLGSGSYKENLVSDRYGHEPITVTFFTDPALGLPAIGDHAPTQDSITITFPDGQVLAGAGWITGDNLGDMVSDEVLIGTREFTFKGGATPPTWS